MPCSVRSWMIDLSETPSLQGRPSPCPRPTSPSFLPSFFAYVHSPTLVILAALLAALVTSVLYAVWYFHRNIPGLRLWVLSFLGATVFSTTLLLRTFMPEVVSVLLAQASIALASYTCLMGSRAYVGRSPLGHGAAAVGMVLLLALSAYFTVVHPHPGARFALAGLFSGPCFLLTARTLARGGFRNVPVRYLVGTAIGAHGLFVLVRPALFKLSSPLTGFQWNDELLELLSQFVVLEATLALVLIGFGVLMLTHEFTTRELRHLAEVDPLTSVFNRRAFLTLLDKAISNAQRTQSALPVLVMDLDHFKRINDTWGHHCGDDVLRHFVQLAGRCLRKEDVMGRLGGEEFAIFLPNADGLGAAAVAERLRSTVESQLVESLGPQGRNGPPLTVSVGVALFAEPDTGEAVLQRADEAMYLAKQRGRNRVEVLQR